MRICVIGSGAIGGLIGGRLALAGADVTLVDRGERLHALESGGLTLIEPDGTQAHTRDFAAASLPDVRGPFGLLVLATKAHQIGSVAAEVAGLMEPDSVLLTVQNGLPWWYFQRHGGEHEGRRLDSVDPDGAIADRIPTDGIVGAVAYPAATVHEPGVVRHVEGDRIPIGALQGTGGDRNRRVASILESAGFRCRVLEDVRSEIWLKAVGSLAFNPLSVLTGATLGGLCRFPPTRELALSMMREAEQVCGRFGIGLRATPEQRIAGAEAVGEHKTSMLQDLEAGRTLEIEAILGAVIELARLEKLATPHLDAVYAATRLLAAEKSLSD